MFVASAIGWVIAVHAARIGPCPWACPQSRAAHHGYNWCALTGEGVHSRTCMRESCVGLWRESAFGRGLARKAGRRTTATTGAPWRARVCTAVRPCAIRALACGANRPVSVGLPAEPGCAPRLRLVRPDGRGCARRCVHARFARWFVARIGVRPWACPQSRAAHHGYDWCALPGEGVHGRASMRDSCVDLWRESAFGRGLARRAGRRTTATTGAP
ncbi:MAG: hypothetical protein RL689_1868 [Planctomycetota bacterium]